jgi:preprotein translocase subunit SecE
MANRQMRRQQAQMKPTARGAVRPGSLRSPAAAGAGAGGRRRGGGVFSSAWVKDIISELRKVTWPTRSEAWNLTLVVILVSVVVGATLGGLDSLFAWLMEHVILR